MATRNLLRDWWRTRVGYPVYGIALFGRDPAGNCEFNEFRLWIGGVSYVGHVCGERRPERVDPNPPPWPPPEDGFDSRQNPQYRARFTDAFVFDDGSRPSKADFRRASPPDVGSFEPSNAGPQAADVLTADGETVFTLELIAQQANGLLVGRSEAVAEITGGSGRWSGAKGNLTYSADPFVTDSSPGRMRITGRIRNVILDH